MKGKRKNTSDIDFGRDKVTVYLTDAEYERIESVGRDGNQSSTSDTSCAANMSSTAPG